MPIFQTQGLDEILGVGNTSTKDATVDELTTTTGLITNLISERTAGSGVTIDSVLLKDGNVQRASGDMIIGPTAGASNLYLASAGVPWWVLTPSANLEPTVNLFSSVGSSANNLYAIYTVICAASGTNSLLFGTLGTGTCFMHSAATNRWGVLGTPGSGGTTGDFYPAGNNLYSIGNSTNKVKQIDVTDIVCYGELKGGRVVILYGFNGNIVPSTGATYLRGVNGVACSATKGFRAPRAGSIVGIAQQFTVSTIVAGTTVVTTARVNGSGTLATTCTVTAGAGSDDGSHTTVARATHTFSAGDIISPYTSGTWSGTTSGYQVAIELQFDT